LGIWVHSSCGIPPIQIELTNFFFTRTQTLLRGKIPDLDKAQMTQVMKTMRIMVLSILIYLHSQSSPTFEDVAMQSNCGGLAAAKIEIDDDEFSMDLDI
jgi:hypothetical protein